MSKTRLCLAALACGLSVASAGCSRIAVAQYQSPSTANEATRVLTDVRTWKVVEASIDGIPLPGGDCENWFWEFENANGSPTLAWKGRTPDKSEFAPRYQSETFTTRYAIHAPGSPGEEWGIELLQSPFFKQGKVGYCNLILDGTGQWSFHVRMLTGLDTAAGTWFYARIMPRTPGS
jgi:hypothetical protein